MLIIEKTIKSFYVFFFLSISFLLMRPLETWNFRDKIRKIKTAEAATAAADKTKRLLEWQSY